MLRVTSIWGSAIGGPHYTNFYFGGISEAQAVAAHKAVADYWLAMQPNLDNGLALTVSPDVEVVDPASGQITEVFNVPTVQRTFGNTGEPLPWASQGLIRWRTGVYVAGREIRGRTFLPGLVESQLTEGVLAPAVVSALQALAQGLVDDTDSGAAGGLVIWSPTHGVAADVNLANVWPQLAVLRSRRPL